MLETQSKVGCDAAVLWELVHAGTLAPSGDNTQPWTFAIDPTESRITVSVDPTRDQSPMNAGQRMARIAVGAAVENIVQTAARNGAGTVVEPSPDGSQVIVKLLDAPQGPILQDEAVVKRCTNRRQYRPQPVPEETRRQLADAVQQSDGVSAQWIFSRDRIESLAGIIQQADRITFGLPAFRNAFLANVRFDAPDLAEVEEGLSLGVLEVASSERRAFRMLPKLPVWLCQFVRIGNVFAKKSRELVESASGLCLGTAADDKPATDFIVGRNVQSAWLELTRRGFAVQPMMSLIVLTNAQQHGILAARESDQFHSLMQELATVCQFDGQPAFLLRFGDADAPSTRTGRLSPVCVAD